MASKLRIIDTLFVMNVWLKINSCYFSLKTNNLPADISLLIFQKTTLYSLPQHNATSILWFVIATAYIMFHTNISSKVSIFCYIVLLYIFHALIIGGFGFLGFSRFVGLGKYRSATPEEFSLTTQHFRLNLHQACTVMHIKWQYIWREERQYDGASIFEIALMYLE